MSTYNKSKIVSNVLRSLSTSSVRQASHYDALGITPSATQSDIKTAYYKLSMRCHPDKANDAESARQFRAISEAYEVLGNVKLKKLYDRGLVVGRENTSRMSSMHYHPEPEPTDPTLKFYKSHEFRHVTPTMDGRRPIYDFDTWSKNHYGTILNKTLNDRRINRDRAQKRLNVAHSMHRTYVYIMTTTIVLTILLLIIGKADYDKDLISKQLKQRDYITKMEHKTSDNQEEQT